MRQMISQSGQNGSAGSGKWSKLLDIGYLFHGLQLVFNGAAIAIGDILQLTYKINGIVQWQLSAVELNDINVRDGIPTFGATGNVFLIPFDLMNFKDQRMREQTAINTGQPSPANGKEITTHELLVNLNPAANQDFTIYADVEDSTPDGPGLVRKFTQYISAATTAAQGTTFSKFDYALPENAWWRRVWTKADAGLVLSQSLLATKLNLWGPEQIPTSVVNALALAYGQAALGYFSAVLDFGMSGGGYTAVPKVVPADPRMPDKGPRIVADTGSNPLLFTMPLKDKTITLRTVNDTATNNNFLVEALGEIE